MAEWQYSQLRDAAANDSDKTFTVKGGEELHIDAIYVTLVSTSTVGNRVLAVRASDSAGNVLWTVEVSAVQAASLTRYYLLSPTMPDIAVFRGANSDLSMTPIPDVILRPGSTLRIWDSTAVAAAADDMTVQITATRRGVVQVS